VGDCQADVRDAYCFWAGGSALFAAANLPARLRGIVFIGQATAAAAWAGCQSRKAIGDFVEVGGDGRTPDRTGQLPISASCPSGFI
jgi:hypothetical protein